MGDVFTGNPNDELEFHWEYLTEEEKARVRVLKALDRMYE